MARMSRVKLTPRRAPDPAERPRVRSRLDGDGSSSDRHVLRTRVTGDASGDDASDGQRFRSRPDGGAGDALSTHGERVVEEESTRLGGGDLRLRHGNPRGAGRPPGTPNRLPRQLMESIVEAARNIGRDGKGKDQLVGYLEHLAVEHPSVFGSLLGRLIPKKVDLSIGGMAGELLDAIRTPRFNGYEPPWTQRMIEHRSHDDT
jgi:hypothetical protein